MKQNETQLSPKIAKNYSCEYCDYCTCKLTDYKKHLLTDKHKKRLHETEMKQNVAKNLQFECICGICFNSRSTLWRHKKNCQPKTQPNNESIQAESHESSDKELIMMLIKENNELKQMMMEVIKNGTHNNSHNTNTHTNSHNKTFNLNLFLNETCKNAMNITDFVNSITLQLSDLEKMGEIGYVEGITNIITTNLKALDVTQRPIHCTDKKRETLYVKDEDKWDKEPNDHPKVRHAIKHVAHKNSKLIPEFKDKYPECVKSDSKKSDQYNKLIIEAMGGYGDNDTEKEDQIIKKITKEVTIEKYIE
jgi:hypothetical protein